jgi:hypothetical protein
LDSNFAIIENKKEAKKYKVRLKGLYYFLADLRLRKDVTFHSQIVCHCITDARSLDNLSDFFSLDVKAIIGMKPFQINQSAPLSP